VHRIAAALLALSAAACSSSNETPAAPLDAAGEAPSAAVDAAGEAPQDAPAASNLGAACSASSECTSGYRTTCFMSGVATVDHRCTFTCGTAEDVSACAALGGACAYPATPDASCAGDDASLDAGCDATPFDADAYYMFCLPR
jgi:hypothetical protein